MKPNMIREFILTQFEHPPQSGEENYIQTGCVSSMGTMQLIVALEQRFGIEITDNDMLSPGFKTLDGLTALVEGKVR
jgi:acyl carrier protein